VESLDVAVGLRSAGMDAAVTGLSFSRVLVKAVAKELVAVVGEHSLKPPAGCLQLPGDALGELARLPGGGVALFAS
jgi:hypothetical protein